MGHISLVLSASQNGVVGDHDDRPWRLTADDEHKKSLITDRSVILGRKTFEAEGHKLPPCRCYVVTTDPVYKAGDCKIVHSLDEALQATADQPEVFVLGGASLFKQCLPLAEQIYLTRVHTVTSGDSYIRLDPATWQQLNCQEHNADGDNQYDYSFLTLERKMV